MPASDSPQVLVARFLKSSGYDKTLAAFLQESGLHEDNVEPRDPATALTLEKVLDEKRLYDLSLNVEDIVISHDDPEFTDPYPSVPTEITSAGRTRSNILFVTVVPKLDPFCGPVLLSTAVDRSLRLVSAIHPHALLRNFTTPSDSVLLSLAVIKEKWIITSSMTGRLTILNPDTGDTVTSIRPHEKYATRVLYEEPYVISSAYDKTLCVHSLVFHESGLPSFAEDRVGKIQLSTPPEALAVVSLPAKSEKALVFSRRDSTFLFYHLLQDGLPFHSERNLAPGASSWVSYHPMSIAVNPVNPKILAVGTSSTPHMKLMLVEVDTENVLKEVFTGAPQSAYSTAVVQWRPDASGVWLNGDEGIVRGVGVKCGKVRCSLKASEGGEKVRTLWAGVVEGAGEVLVTGGFDKGLNIWVVEREE